MASYSYLKTAMASLKES